jgi:hypothetical protein
LLIFPKPVFHYFSIEFNLFWSIVQKEPGENIEKVICSQKPLIVSRGVPYSSSTVVVLWLGTAGFS